MCARTIILDCGTLNIAMGRDWVCTRTIALDCETLNLAMGRDWVCTRTIALDRDFKHSNGEGLGVYKDHNNRRLGNLKQSKGGGLV